MLTGLSAFPLTPIRDDSVDERAFAGLVERLVTAGVDSIGALGSTGAYPYLTREERRRVAQLAVAHAGEVPVVVGIGALRTSDVLACAADAQTAGAAALLLAPVSYQPLTADEVHGLFEQVTAAVDVPVVLYDNPRTTRFTFTPELYAAIARLPHVAAVKIPGVPGPQEDVEAHVALLRSVLPAHVRLAVSGDHLAAAGLRAGCDAWATSIGGTLPEVTVALTRAVQRGDVDAAAALDERLAPLWALVAQHGGMRVAAAAAEHLGLVDGPCLPLPVRGLDPDARAQVVSLLDAGIAEAS